MKVRHERRLTLTHSCDSDFDDNPIQGLPEFVFFRGMTKLPGPRWDLLRPHFEKELQLNLVGDEPDDD